MTPLLWMRLTYMNFFLRPWKKVAATTIFLSAVTFYPVVLGTTPFVRVAGTIVMAILAYVVFPLFLILVELDSDPEGVAQRARVQFTEE